MADFCGHLDCLSRELHTLVTLEHDVWRLSSRGGVSYKSGMADLAQVLAAGAHHREP